MANAGSKAPKCLSGKTKERTGKHAAAKDTVAKKQAVLEEEQLLHRVKQVLASAGAIAEGPDYDAQLVSLRDMAAEEKLPEDQASLFEEMDRVAAISRTRARWSAKNVDSSSPYFAHLGLLTDDGEHKDILLGKNTFVRDNVRIADWRHAPISKIYYRYQEGDAFVEEFARRQVSGQVTKRRAVTIVNGQLVRVASKQFVYLRTSDGWQDVSSDTVCLQGGAESAARPDTTSTWPETRREFAKVLVPILGEPDRHRLHRADKRLPEIASLLDREQFDLLTRQGDSMLVVSGGAGSGKTTVGLHRLAYLAFLDAKRYRPKRMQVVVFSPALGRYVSRVLPALGLTGVPVTTLGEWAMEQRRKHFPGLPRSVCHSTPAVVVRFKTQVVLLRMLEEAAKTAPTADPVLLFDDLFTDRGWIWQGIQRFYPGAFSESEVAQIHRWCTDQQFRRFDGPVAQAEEGLPCYDEEDAMILLRLYQLLRGRMMYAKKRKLSYDHLMVDEAQDFSPLELAVLLQTIPGGSVTLAGDAAQKITDNDFSGWSELLEAIGQESFEISHLRVSYRSTRQVMELAQAVLGPLAPREPWQASRSGSPVELLRFESLGGAMTFLAESLSDLSRREPSASVAVLGATSQHADEAFASLCRTELDRIRRVRDEEFSFGPGIEVTDVASAKGLEFDYVVMLQVDRVSYPDTLAARRLLHVGCSRAIHQLWLLTWSSPSPLLPEWLEPRLAGVSSAVWRY